MSSQNGCTLKAAAQQPPGQSVSALATALGLQCIRSLPSEKPSEPLESWRTQVYYASSGLRGDRSPEPEPRRRVSQGFYGQPLLGVCLAGRTRVRTGRVVIAEATLQKQMHGGGVVRSNWLDFAESSWLGSLLFYQDVSSYSTILVVVLDVLFPFTP